MQIPEFNEIIEQNDQTEARLASLEALRELVGNVYPNKFERSRVSGREDTITDLINFGPVVGIVNEIKAVIAKLAEKERPPSEIKDTLNARLREFGNVRIAGRLTTPPRGNFVHLTDGMKKLQVYAKKGTFALVKNDADGTIDDENGWAAWELLDHGDFMGVEGYLFITNTGELSVHVEKLQFLAKAMLPMPDKMHGIADAEIRQRQRYYDLIGSSLAVEHEGLTTREVFERRAKVISSMRSFLEDHGYVEVETPMLTPKATGAVAKPFETHHNALDITLYARIAPELYLKRLVVGGFEKVYELNRNFRNEGISYKHNPEFTMLEFYCAYMDVEGMMDLCEEMLRQAVQKATGSLSIEYEGKTVNFGKFERLSMREAIIRHFPDRWRLIGQNSLSEEWLTDPLTLSKLTLYVQRVFIAETEGTLTQLLHSYRLHKEAIWEGVDDLVQIPHEPGSELVQLFDIIVEPNLTQPTFIIDFPKSISPLSKASPENPNIAERFELFINGMEIANGFSELNDPKEQYERFVDQMSLRTSGDEEAMILDEDYIRALSYGMPPTAGIGIGIDRLVMLLTNKHSIRDVILFPHLRPEGRQAAADDGGSTG